VPHLTGEQVHLGPVTAQALGQAEQRDLGTRALAGWQVVHHEHPEWPAHVSNLAELPSLDRQEITVRR
jgi:hypothetical protein